MADGYQISDSLKDLSLEKTTGGRKTDRIRFRMVTGTVAGFHVPKTSPKLAVAASRSRGEDRRFSTKQKIEPVKVTSTPIEGTQRRKCTLWLQSDD